MTRHYHSTGKALEKFTARIMLGLIFIVMMAAASAGLSGCATTQQTQAAYTQGCATYAVALQVAAARRSAGKLNDEQIKQISLIDSQVTPICTGPLPANPDAALTQITAAVTSLLILEAAQP